MTIRRQCRDTGTILRSVSFNQETEVEASQRTADTAEIASASCSETCPVSDSTDGSSIKAAKSDTYRLSGRSFSLRTNSSGSSSASRSRNVLLVLSDSSVFSSHSSKNPICSLWATGATEYGDISASFSSADCQSSVSFLPRPILIIDSCSSVCR